MDKLEIKLRTLTPIWTGGVEKGKVDRIHETGILGSLRWWYEALVRGLGEWACDPTESGCIYKREREESHEQAYSRLCSACQLFGCTGWQRRFRLSVEPADARDSTRFCLATLDRPGQFNHWWLSQVFENAMGQPLPLTDVDLQIQFWPGSESYTAALRGLLSVMADYGGIGAKTQYGFGQFDWAEKLSAAAALDAIRKQLNTQFHSTSPQPSGYYTLRHFWHLACVVPEADPLVRRFTRAHVVGHQQTFDRWRQRYLPISFDIRYKLPGTDHGLRQRYRQQHGKMAARKVLGTLKGEKRGSRIFVSHLYGEDATDKNYWFNVWGFTEPDIGEEMSGYVNEMFTTAEIEMTTGHQLLGQEKQPNRQHAEEQ